MSEMAIFHQLTRLSTQLEPRIPSGLPTTRGGWLFKGDLFCPSSDSNFRFRAEAIFERIVL